ncbi:phosphatases II, partial [Fistulina hepatica ATCC 64428]
AVNVCQVDNVLCAKAGASYFGTLHLTAHHLIFEYEDDSQSSTEIWVPYSLISLVTKLPQTLQGQCPLSLHTRTFESYTFTFVNDASAADVFESVRDLTVVTSVYKLYAFFYTPNPPLLANNGWNLYSPKEEFGRMGVGTRSKAWRFTHINKDYSFCPTYPALLVVPTRISDTTLQYASRYRSKARIPTLTYLHWANYGSITRSSQPMVGLKQNRSVQDEKLIEAIFQSHMPPESRAANVQVYGATATNLIIDARPTTNAVANTAKGAGTENMEHYRESKKVYLGIDNIYTMRESLARVVEALREADTLIASLNGVDDLPRLATLDRQALRRSGWLRHISAILEGTVLITRNVHINSSHVLVHCSDGWDRTAQLSSLAQLCLDPYYRTINGFQVLVEKDWLSFGHRFMDRCGHLSSDKFFVTAPEQTTNGSNVEAAQAFLASLSNRFASQSHLKETSPVFHQFLEAVRQIQRQYPDRFEFNERFLQRIYYHLYSCQFGTFLFNSEQERHFGNPPPTERTVSIWDWLNSSREMEVNTNPDYEPALDNPANRDPSADMGVLQPNPKDVRFWHELYGWTDEEMNGRMTLLPPAEAVDLSVVVETETPGSRPSTPSEVPLPSSPRSSSVVSLAAYNPPPRRLSNPLTASRGVVQPTSPPPPLTDSQLSTTSTLLPLDESSSSVFSLKPPGAHTGLSPSRSPVSSRSSLQDVSGGMKSVWGRLSSSASAALSAAQDAYAGVAKEFRGAELPTSTSKVVKLRDGEALQTWDTTEVEASASSSQTFASSLQQSPLSRSAPVVLPSENPWAKAAADPLPSLFDNPWETRVVATQPAVSVD